MLCTHLLPNLCENLMLILHCWHITHEQLWLTQRLKHLAPVSFLSDLWTCDLNLDFYLIIAFFINYQLMCAVCFTCIISLKSVFTLEWILSPLNSWSVWGTEWVFMFKSATTIFKATSVFYQLLCFVTSKWLISSNSLWSKIKAREKSFSLLPFLKISIVGIEVMSFPLKKNQKTKL